MKKTLKILAISIFSIFLFVVSAIIVIPVVFKEPMLKKLRHEINKNLYAEVDFDDINLSIIRTFPDLGLSIDGLNIKGVGEFEGKNLLKADNISVTIDIRSVIRGSNYEIKSIELESPEIYIMFLEDGKANFDIFIPADEQISEEIDKPEDDAEGSLFVLSLSSVISNNTNFIYDDRIFDIFLRTSEADLVLTGDLTATTTSIMSYVEVGSAEFIMDGIKFIDNGTLYGNANVDIDFDIWKFSFLENEFVLNNMPLGLDGYFTMNDDSSFDMDIEFITDMIEFKDLLSLVPAIYMSDMQGLEADGRVELSAYLKGKLAEEEIPAFDFSLDVENAMFRYPDLPKSVDNIFISAKINNPDGNIDNTVIDLSQFKMNLGGNPLDFTLKAKNPVSNPEFLFSLNTQLDLSSLEDVLPLEGIEELSGNINADFHVDGKMSYIENEQFDKINAKGGLDISNFIYKDTDLPYSVLLNSMQLIFSPQYVELNNFYANVGESDFRASGKIDNLYSYFFAGETLEATFNFNSNYINANELMPETDDAPAKAEAEPDISQEYSQFNAVQIPDNINFSLNTRLNKIDIDDITVENIAGNILVKDSKADMSNLSMDIFDGKISMSGAVNTQNIAKTLIDFSLDVQNINFQSVRESLNFIDSIAPILANCHGVFSTDLLLSAHLDNTLNLSYESVNAKGAFSSRSVQIKDNSSFNRIAELTGNNRFKDPSIRDVNFNYTIENGKMEISPFDISYANSQATIFGYNTLDLEINYQADLSVPREHLGSQANQMAENALSELESRLGISAELSDNIDFSVFITGSLTEPEISLNIRDIAESTVSGVRDQIKDEVRERVEEVRETVEETVDRAKEEAIQRARQNADRIINNAKQQRDRMVREAENQANNVRSAGASSAETIRREARTQADRLISEAGSNPLAKRAAERSAEEVINEADRRAKGVEDEANRNADNIVNTAKREGDKIVDDAKKEADRLIKEAEEM